MATKTTAPQRDSTLFPLLGVDIRTQGKPPVHVDIQRLLVQKLLIYAGSSGGKSFAMRRLIEQMAGRLQQIIIDPEGQLNTLSEVCGIDVYTVQPDKNYRMAGESAKRLHKSQRSIVIDLSRLETDHQQIYMNAFLRGLMAIPESSWHNMIVYVDEAQLFAPQHERSYCKGAMVDFSNRGRKRGLGVVMATQRLAQLHKGVVGNFQNFLIGETKQSLDIARAAKELGSPLPEVGPIIGQLQAGQFFAKGRCIHEEGTVVKIGQVKSRHENKLPFTAPVETMSEEELKESFDADLRPWAAESVLDEDVPASSRFKSRRDEPKEARGPSRPHWYYRRSEGAPPPLTSKALQEHEARQREEDALRRAVAEFRFWVIEDLVNGTGTHGELTAKCRALGLNRNTVRRWMEAYAETETIESLVPKIVRANMVAELNAWHKGMQAFETKH